MYPVSEAFLQAVQGNTRKYYWTGKITTASGEKFDRYTLEDAEVELFYHLRLASGAYETVPMGIFVVSEANRTAYVLGGSFCINRAGKLEFRQYGKTPVMEILQNHRFSSCFSDFVTRYTAVSSTNLRTQTSEYYALETDDGLTMNLGVNPLLQFGGQARSC